MPQKKTITTLLFSIMFVVGLAFVGSAIPASAQAQATDTTPFSLVPECARSRDASTIPGLDCALLTFQNIASIIFGISGSVALLMFVYGGFLTLISGFSDQVKKGKEMIKNAVIGFFIIVIAAYGVDYFVSKLTEGNVQSVD